MVLHGIFDLADLAYAARVPLGIEIHPGPRRWASDGVRVTGLTVRDALSALLLLDPDYEWREFDGVHFEHALLEPGMTFTPGPDRGADIPRFSIDTPSGSLLLLLNAVARAHGELCWIYEELNGRDTAFFGGRSRQVTIRVPAGGGGGFAFR
jgi:hypothetical protein